MKTAVLLYCRFHKCKPNLLRENVSISPIRFRNIEVIISNSFIICPKFFSTLFPIDLKVLL